MSRRRERAVRVLTLLVGTASIAGACWPFAEVGGVLVAVAVAIVAAASTRFYGVAVAHLLILGLTREPTFVTVALLEAGSFAYFVTELDAGFRARDGVALAAAVAVFAGSTWLAARDFGTLRSGIALVAVGGGIGYLLHRYGELRLGLLTEEGT